MTEYTAKKVIFKNRDNEYLIPYIDNVYTKEEIDNAVNSVIPNNAKLISHYTTLDLGNAVRVSTAPVSDTTFTAPSDGVFQHICVATTTNSWVALSINGDRFTSNCMSFSWSGKDKALMATAIEVSKGDYIVLNAGNVTYSYTGCTNLGLWFIPTKGGQ